MHTCNRFFALVCVCVCVCVIGDICNNYRFLFFFYDNWCSLLYSCFEDLVILFPSISNRNPREFHPHS